MKFFVFILSFLFVVPAWSQKSRGKTEEVIPVAIPEGITYALPRTAVRIVVKAIQTTVVPGPFAAYADPLLGISNVPTQSVTSWEIRQISFDSFAEPDPAKVFKTNNLAIPLIQLSPEGVLTGFNAEKQAYSSKSLVSNSFAVNGSSLPVLFTNTVQLATSSGRTSAAQRAEEAAAAILKARAARNEIVAGTLDEFHPDGKAYEESLEELRLAEKETLELFTGKRQTREFTFSWVYIPVSKSVKGEVLFRFDESLGFLAKNDFSGKPVMIDVEAEEIPAVAAPGTVLPSTGLFYRQPGTGNFRLYKELSLIGTARLPIAQFGNTLSVPAELLNGSYSLLFSPQTGALESILKK